MFLSMGNSDATDFILSECVYKLQRLVLSVLLVSRLVQNTGFSYQFQLLVSVIGLQEGNSSTTQMRTSKQHKSKLSKEDALSFLLTHIVIERNSPFEMNQINLFRLTQMATEAVALIEQEDDIIPHEVIEKIALGFES